MSVIWVGSGRFNAYIGPVQDYIDRVVAADVAAGNTLGLEVGVRDSYDVFIRDSINAGDLGTSAGVLSQANSIIKAAPILAGAQTVPGALTPLVGPAPTNYGFASDDYNRKTGLAGKPEDSKYLDSNRNNNADPQNNKHLALYVSTAGFPSGSTQVYATNLFIATEGMTSLGIFSGGQFTRNNCTNSTTIGLSTATGFCGTSRNQSGSYTHRLSGANNTISQVSAARASGNIFIYRDPNASFPLYTNARFAFYSIGESLNLASLDARITTLMTAIAAAF